MKKVISLGFVMGILFTIVISVVVYITSPDMKVAFAQRPFDVIVTSVVVAVFSGLVVGSLAWYLSTYQEE